MKTILSQIWKRFKSTVPPIIKKIQIVLGLASASFTTGAAISWPGKMAFVGTFCSYAAAVCAGIVLALQFIEESVTVLETKRKLQ